MTRILKKCITLTVLLYEYTFALTTKRVPGPGAIPHSHTHARSKHRKNPHETRFYNMNLPLRKNYVLFWRLEFTWKKIQLKKKGRVVFLWGETRFNKKEKNRRWKLSKVSPTEMAEGGGEPGTNWAHPQLLLDAVEITRTNPHPMAAHAHGNRPLSFDTKLIFYYSLIPSTPLHHSSLRQIHVNSSLDGNVWFKFDAHTAKHYTS